VVISLFKCRQGHERSGPIDELWGIDALSALVADLDDTDMDLLANLAIALAAIQAGSVQARAVFERDIARFAESHGDLSVSFWTAYAQLILDLLSTDTGQASRAA